MPDDKKWTLSALRLMFFRDEDGEIAQPVYDRLLKITDKDYARSLCKFIQDRVIEDVFETSAWQEEGVFSDGDISLAIGRVLVEMLRQWEETE